MRFLSLLCWSGLLILPATIQAEDGVGLRPLRTICPAKLASILPSDTHVLIERSAIEAFLVALEGAPPDWAMVYGHGHHDPGHDERLFNLNRERDAAREGNPVLDRRVAFVWPGELSQFDPETKSYAVAVGPEVTSTRWGMVRFKPEELPSNLRVRPNKQLGARINEVSPAIRRYTCSSSWSAPSFLPSRSSMIFRTRRRGLASSCPW